MTPPRSELTEVQRIPLDRIKLSPLNVRQEIDVGSLTCSIGRTGQIEPLRVRTMGEVFEIRTGRRRFLALKEAGATHANAIIVEGTDEEVITEQWNENEERADYTDYERALKLRQMLDALGLNQEQLSERIGMSRSRIAQFLRILKLEGIVTIVTLRMLLESQARAILAAPEADWPALVNYVELYLEEKGELLPASAIEDYAQQLAHATEIGKNRRRFLYEIEEEAAGAEELPGTAEEAASEAKAYIEEHDLGWVFDAEANGAGFLTKIGMLTDEELAFCLTHETRPLSIQRLNEETDRRGTDRGLKPLLKAPSSSATDPRIVASINRMVGEPAEAIPVKLMEEHGLTEEEAQAALESYRETYPDIWSTCYPDESEGEAEEPEEPMTAEQYVADVLTHNPGVGHEELAKATAEMFGVSEAYAMGLIDRNQSKKRGPKPRDPYAARSPITTCPLCGRANAEKNRILMVLEEYQASKPGITLVDWLKEVLA